MSSSNAGLSSPHPWAHGFSWPSSCALSPTLPDSCDTALCSSSFGRACPIMQCSASCSMCCHQWLGSHSPSTPPATASFPCTAPPPLRVWASWVPPAPMHVPDLPTTLNITTFNIKRTARFPGICMLSLQSCPSAHWPFSKWKLGRTGQNSINIQVNGMRICLQREGIGLVEVSTC